MVGIFDGFPMGIFDDAIFDTKNPSPPVLKIRLSTSINLPSTSYAAQVLTVDNP